MQHKAKWIDSPVPKVISVTKIDIKQAICKDHQNCVIAKAIKRQVGAHFVDVGNKTVLIRQHPTGRVTRYLLGTKAQEQVKFFDKEGNFAPCFVELTPPPPSLRLGQLKEYSKSYAERVKRKLNKNRNRKRKSLATR